MTAYDFGPRHPLRPERLRRAMRLLEAWGVTAQDPGEGRVEDVLRVHDRAFVDTVRRLSAGEDVGPARSGAGFGSLDNPVFAGMYEASLAYNAGSVAAGEAVRDGAPLAIALAGGLHHAHRGRASGFCVFNDAAAAVHVLRERFDRVAYVDIDVHHGDGVQWLYFDDPSVLTCSIHEGPRTLFPGTGGVEETGEAFTSVNVPLAPGTTGEVWMRAFRGGVMPALQRFDPGAIVLQMGTDAHMLDPLAHLRVTAQEWLEAVREVRDLGKPIVAVGGGGYHLDTVPRMWAAASLTLMGREVPNRLPEPLAAEWGVSDTFDALPDPRGGGDEEASATVRWLQGFVHPNVPPPKRPPQVQ